MTLEFLVRRQEYDLEDLVFVDECGINLQMARLVGWAPKGQRLFDSKPGAYAKNYTVLGGMTQQGMEALMTIEGGTSSAVFYQFAQKVLLPQLQPGQVVVLDNLTAHRTQETRELFEEHGVHLLFIPPYSPEWNPIEWAWSKVKTFLRQYAARSLQALEDALVQAADLVSPQEATNMILECGYNPPETCL
ncbi:MAG: IS630 family transposase [Myxococcota bacterium]